MKELKAFHTICKICSHFCHVCQRQEQSYICSSRKKYPQEYYKNEFGFLKPFLFFPMCKMAHGNATFLYKIIKAIIFPYGDCLCLLFIALAHNMFILIIHFIKLQGSWLWKGKPVIEKQDLLLKLVSKYFRR